MPHILMDSGGLPHNVTRPWFEWFLETSRRIRAGGQRILPEKPMISLISPRGRGIIS